MKTWFPGKGKFPILFIMCKGGRRRRGGKYSPPLTLTVNIRTMILNLQLFAAFCFVRTYVFLIQKFNGEPPLFSDKLELSRYVPRFILQLGIGEFANIRFIFQVAFTGNPNSRFIFQLGSMGNPNISCSFFS